jgi:hypothetical protein
VYLEILLGLTAFFGAVGANMLLTDPSGEAAGIPTVYRDLLPVGDFLLPGLFLLVAYVAVPVFVGYGLITRREWGWTAPIERRVGLHWSWAGVVGLALVMLAWIGIEVVLFWSAPSDIMTNLWVLITALAAALLIGTALPSVRRYCSAA